MLNRNLLFCLKVALFQLVWCHNPSGVVKDCFERSGTVTSWLKEMYLKQHCIL